MTENIEQILKLIYSKPLTEKKTWYSSAAEAYEKARPDYPQTLIDRAREVANLSSDSAILEIGCGPGKATVSFAPFGCRILCIEPNSDFCRLAERTCGSHPNVTIQNVAFEEWELQAKAFDAILAATSFHWIPPEIAFPKAADALKNDGFLILMWNMIPELSDEVFAVCHDAYHRYAPSISTSRQDISSQENHLTTLGGHILKSKRFSNPIFERVACEKIYDVDDYLLLLASLSQYIALESQTRAKLFDAIKQCLERTCGKSVRTFYLSAVHIAQKLA